MKIANSLLSRSKSWFDGKKSPLVTFYVCGPTVYDSAHLGHGRTYVLFDAMRRVLSRVLHKEVIFAMNITDVDDKILHRCKTMNQTRESLTAKHEADFFHDMQLLGVARPTLVPRATEYIPEMIAFIGRLTQAGFAYRTPDGSVYLDTSKTKEMVGYPGPLGKGNELSMEPSTSTFKRHDADFALWKATGVEDTTCQWDCAPFGGMGRPGWHLECSAMIDHTLGRVNQDGCIDLHGGGIDLCFPHHANEQAQSQLLIPSKPWVQFFIHTGHVTIHKDKMSKSLNNFITLKDLFTTKVLTPRQLRLLFLSQKKYTNGLEWSTGSVLRAKALDAELESVCSYLLSSSPPKSEKEAFTQADIDFAHTLGQIRQASFEAMQDDFDFPQVFDHAQKLCKLLNQQPGLNGGLARQAREFLVEILEILGFQDVQAPYPFFHSTTTTTTPSSEIDLLPDVVAFRAKVRQLAKAKDVDSILKECDEFRNHCSKAHGVVIQDLKDGSSSWKRRFS